MEKYMSAARKISRLAVGIRPSVPTSKTYALSPFLMQNERMNEDLPVRLAWRNRNPASLFRWTASTSSRCACREIAKRDSSSASPSTPCRPSTGWRKNQVVLNRRRERGPSRRCGGGNCSAGLQAGPVRAQGGCGFNGSLPSQGRRRLLQVAFLKEHSAAEGVFPPLSQANYTEARQLETSERAWADPPLSSVSLTGPFAAKGPGNTPSRPEDFRVQSDRPRLRRRPVPRRSFPR